jgi:hypothetical protein
MGKLMRMLALCSFFAFAGIAHNTPAYSQLHLHVRLTPPAIRTEILPPRPQPTAIWTPGYYRFDALTQSYVWTPGSWQVPPSQAMVWVAPRYISRGDGYDFYAGHWATRHQAEEEREAQERLER